MFLHIRCLYTTTANINYWFIVRKKGSNHLSNFQVLATFSTSENVFVFSSSWPHASLIFNPSLCLVWSVFNFLLFANWRAVHHESFPDKIPPSQSNNFLTKLIFEYFSLRICHFTEIKCAANSLTLIKITETHWNLCFGSAML